MNSRSTTQRENFIFLSDSSELCYVNKTPYCVAFDEIAKYKSKRIGSENILFPRTHFLINVLKIFVLNVRSAISKIKK